MLSSLLIRRVVRVRDSVRTYPLLTRHVGPPRRPRATSLGAPLWTLRAGLLWALRAEKRGCYRGIVWGAGIGFRGGLHTV